MSTRDAFEACARYLEAFNARDTAAAAGFYADPTLRVGADGARLMTRDEVAAMLARGIERLAAKGFARSRILRHSLHAMNAATTLLSAEFARERADGTTIEAVACTYVLHLGPEGWRIVSTIVHPADRVLPEARDLPGDPSRG